MSGPERRLSEIYKNLETERDILFYNQIETGLPYPQHSEPIIRFELERMNRARQLAGNEDHIFFNELSEDQKFLLTDVRIAVAASNSLTYSDTVEKAAIESRNSQENSHHTRFHDRRQKRWNWTLVYNTPELFYGKNRWLIYSMPLFGRWHDFMQNEYARMGKAEGIEDFDNRAGHQSAAAIFLLLNEK